MPKRGSLGVVASHCRQIDVSGPVLFMPDVPFVLENAKKCPDRGVARRFRQLGLHVGGSRAPLLIKDI
jgi:hypothetical protein